MILDLNQLQVDSFSTSVAGDPSQWGVENGTVADTFVSCAVVDALTEAYPCKTTR